MNTSSKLRVAAVGAGYFSTYQHAAWHRIAEVEQLAICNRSLGPAETVANQYGIPNVYTDFEQMLDETKPDIVDIITPPVTHCEYVMAAIDRGIPVVCQKPFTASLKEARMLVDNIVEKQAKVIIHENVRFQPWYQTVKQILTKRTLGEIYQVTFRLRPGDGQGPDAYLSRQPYFQKMPRLLLHETVVHFIDVFRYLLGEPLSVYTDLRRLNPVIAGEDAGIVLLEFANNAMGIIDGNRLSDHPARNRRLTMGELCVEGEYGSLNINGDAEIYFRQHGENTDEIINYHWQDKDFGGDCVYRFQQHVVNHMLHDAPVMNTAEQYLCNLTLVEACYQSSEQGKKLNMPQNSHFQ